MTWDAVIVGARCAGSPLARFLAQRGKRVLLVDSAKFPSDQPMSTHFIHPFGMRILDELGLGDRVREIAPPVATMRQIVQGIDVRFEFPLGGCCPRRIDLDQLLLDGAREAGAEIKLEHRVVDVLRDGARIAGVVVQDRDGNKTELRANIVVGADGRHSTIAELVGAETYFQYEGPRCAYWAYWPREASYADAPYNGSTFLSFHEDKFRFCFPVNRDQLIIGVGTPRSNVAAFKQDAYAETVRVLREDPLFAKLVEREPVSKTIGIAKAEFFFRRAAGPGWALVGDSGLFKDPTPGLGITDALRDARALSAAIVDDGSDAALERYWRQRDVESFSLFNFARDMGELDYNNPLTRLLFTKLTSSAKLRERMVEVIERRLSPYDAFTPGEVIRWTFGALLRGKFSVLRPFFRAGARGAAIQKELKRRRALLVPALPPASRPASAESKAA